MHIKVIIPEFIFAVAGALSSSLSYSVESLAEGETHPAGGGLVNDYEAHCRRVSLG
jgi:hypothetical protein